MNSSSDLSKQIFSTCLKPFPSLADCSLLDSFLYPSHTMTESSILALIDHVTHQIHPDSFEDPFENEDLEPRPLAPSCNINTKSETRQLQPAEMQQMKGISSRSTLLTMDSDDDAEMGHELFEPLPVAEQDDPIETLYTILDSSSARASESSEGPTESKQSRQKLRHEGTTDEYCDDESISRFRPYQEKLWRIQFKKLIEFKLKNGHCCVPHYYKEDLVLARWVKRQRFQYKKLNENDPTSTMTSRRIEELESIGFVWHSHQATWLEKLNELKAFKEENGHCNVPSHFPENVALSTWVKCQRRQYRLYAKAKISNMNTQRYQALKSLGFVFDVRKEK